jgi:hypothetical protein
MPTDVLIESALAQPEAMARLRQLAVDLRSQGHDKDTISAAFMSYLQRLQAVGGREADEDALMDALDCVTGWCSPHQRVFPS